MTAIPYRFTVMPPSPTPNPHSVVVPPEARANASNINGSTVYRDAQNTYVTIDGTWVAIPNSMFGGGTLDHMLQVNTSNPNGPDSSTLYFRSGDNFFKRNEDGTFSPVSNAEVQLINNPASGTSVAPANNTNGTVVRGGAVVRPEYIVNADGTITLPPGIMVGGVLSLLPNGNLAIDGVEFSRTDRDKGRLYDLIFNNTPNEPTAPDPNTPKPGELYVVKTGGKEGFPMTTLTGPNNPGGKPLNLTMPSGELQKARFEALLANANRQASTPAEANQIREQLRLLMRDFGLTSKEDIITAMASYPGRPANAPKSFWTAKGLEMANNLPTPAINAMITASNAASGITHTYVAKDGSRREVKTTASNANGAIPDDKRPLIGVNAKAVAKYTDANGNLDSSKLTRENIVSGMHSSKGADGKFTHTFLGANGAQFKIDGASLAGKNVTLLNECKAGGANPVDDPNGVQVNGAFNNQGAMTAASMTVGGYEARIVKGDDGKITVQYYNSDKQMMDTIPPGFSEERDAETKALLAVLAQSDGVTARVGLNADGSSLELDYDLRKDGVIVNGAASGNVVEGKTEAQIQEFFKADGTPTIAATALGGVVSDNNNNGVTAPPADVPTPGASVDASPVAL